MWYKETEEKRERELEREKVGYHFKQSYLSRSASAIIVNKMENLLRTVNIGKLQEEDINCFNLAKHQQPCPMSSPSLSLDSWGMRTYFSRLVPNRPVIWFPTYRRGRGNVCKNRNMWIMCGGGKKLIRVRWMKWRKGGVSPFEVCSHHSLGSWSPSQPCPPTALPPWPTSAHTHWRGNRIKTLACFSRTDGVFGEGKCCTKRGECIQLTCPIPTHIEEGNLEGDSRVIGPR